jgi:hypothetical protein
MVEISNPTFGKSKASRMAKPDKKVSKQEEKPVVQELEKVEKPMKIIDLRSLIELGKITDTITIGPMTFEMETLDDDDQELLFASVAKKESIGEDSFVELRRMAVALSIKSVNGRPMEDLISFKEMGKELKSDKETEIIEKKVFIVRSMQFQIVDMLYDFYDSLLKRSKQKVDTEQVKN